MCLIMYSHVSDFAGLMCLICLTQVSDFAPFKCLILLLKCLKKTTTKCLILYLLKCLIKLQKVCLKRYFSRIGGGYPAALLRLHALGSVAPPLKAWILVRLSTTHRPACSKIAEGPWRPPNGPPGLDWSRCGVTTVPDLLSGTALPQNTKAH